LTPKFDVLGIGLNATDTVLELYEFPAYTGKVKFARELTMPGGQVTTALITCARFGLRTKYIGTIGDDERGRIQFESMQGTGVDTSGIIVRRDCANQAAYILVDRRTGERTILWNRPECLRLNESEIREEEIASARLLHLDGYDTDAAAYAARLAKHHQVQVCVDVDEVYSGFERVLENLDYLVASSRWPSEWTSESDPFIALAQVQAEYSLRVAAMTLGDRGALAVENNCWSYSPAFAVECRDTTGAGDVFHGAFCYAVLQGMCVADALEFSNAAAALNCTAVGARGHIPTLPEIRELRDRAAQSTIARSADADIAERIEELRPQSASAHP